MTNLHHVVKFQGATLHMLGLDDIDHRGASVRSAAMVLACIERPHGDPQEFVNRFALSNYERAVEFLHALGSAAIDIQPFGIVVGEYSIGPYLVTMRDVAILQGYA